MLMRIRSTMIRATLNRANVRIIFEQDSRILDAD